MMASYFLKENHILSRLPDQLKAGEGGVHWKSFYLDRLFIKEI